jgi:hypothetical protein
MFRINCSEKKSCKNYRIHCEYCIKNKSQWDYYEQKEEKTGKSIFEDSNGNPYLNPMHPERGTYTQG